MGNEKIICCNNPSHEPDVTMTFWTCENCEWTSIDTKTMTDNSCVD